MGASMSRMWQRVGTGYMPFRDVATPDVPLARLLRLSLFQLTVGMAQAMFFGTLNRVMIVELGVSATLVAIMIAIPMLVAPFRALIGFRSDTYRSVLGWRRVPFLWFGSLLQFGGLSIMPFALILLSGDQSVGPAVAGHVASALAFLLVGIGAHTTQTAGLALATDIVPEEKRPRVVALMYVMLLVGMVVSALVIGELLRDFSQVRLIQVIQATAIVTVVVNVVALWKQEARVRGVKPYARDERRPLFREAWRVFAAGGRAVRLLVAVGLGFFAFNLQDVLLEPYGGEILGLGVGSTTWLTGIAAIGALVAFALAARMLGRGWDPIRVASTGILVGVPGFALVIFAAPLESALLFRAGTAAIGFGEGMFAVGTLSAAMALRGSEHGIALGAWGAVFATSEGLALALSGVLKDALAHLGATGALGVAMSDPSVPYSVIYHVEIAVCFATMVALGPLVSRQRIDPSRRTGQPLGLADLPA